VPTRNTAFVDLPDLLTPAEAGEYLHVSRNGMYELIRRNEIGHVRIGRQIRIPKGTLPRSGPSRATE
jgi:excisionase family DNA binding protein